MSVIKVALHVFRVKNIHSGSPSDPYGPWGEVKLSYIHYNIRQDETKLLKYIKTQFSVSSPPQCRSQVVVCVSTPRMYPRGSYFLVNIYLCECKYVCKSYLNEVFIWERKCVWECLESTIFQPTFIFGWVNLCEIWTQTER